jgi:hypothetical protein
VEEGAASRGAGPFWGLRTPMMAQTAWTVSEGDVNTRNGRPGGLATQLSETDLVG